MTILAFADTRFPIERANGVQTMQTCHALATRGHDITLVVRPDSARPARDPFVFYGLCPTPRLSITSVPSAGPEPVRRASMLWAGLRRTLHTRPDVVFTRDLGLAALLCRWQRLRRPALVYESHGVSAVVAAEMPTLLGRPDLAPSASKLARLDRRDRSVWTSAEGYVTLTQALADDLAVRYGARARVDVVADGAEIPAAVCEAPASGPLVAAYAGHLYPWKGVDVFLEALARVPDLRGLIVGGHPGERDLARVQALITRLDITARVTITGLLPQPDVANALAGAHILVLPNTPTAISDRYTSPLKLFEYLALGRAIVASDLPSLREVLSHNETAVLVQAGDAAALADGLRGLTIDADRRRRLAAAARALAPQYSWAARAARLEAVCEAALAA